MSCKECEIPRPAGERNKVRANVQATCYKVLQDIDREKFEALVADCLNDGWSLVGGAQIHAFAMPIQNLACQGGMQVITCYAQTCVR